MAVEFMEHAIELAERGRGTTHPNPIVGAVVVSGGEVVGEGWHEEKGGPHAEVAALANAGTKARGATVYVTLEPCAHWRDTSLRRRARRSRRRPCRGGARPIRTRSTGAGSSLRGAEVEVELADDELGFRCRQQIEEWRTWVTRRDRS